MLSKLQKKILKLNAINSKYTNKDLATILKVSPDTVDYHIQKLKEYGSFSTIFNYHNLGFTDYHMLFSVYNLEQINIEALAEINSITFINSSFGKYDFQCIIVVKNLDELTTVEKNIKAIIGSNLKSSLLFSAKGFLKYLKVLPEYDVDVKLPTKRNEFYLLNDTSHPLKEKKELTLDNEDMKIIKSLIENSKDSLVSIANKNNLTRDVVAYRIKKFIASNFITSFTFKPNLRKFGYITVMVLLKAPTIEQSEMKVFLENQKQIYFATQTYGNHNYLLYVVAKNTSDFSEQFTKIRNNFKEKIHDFDMLFFDKVYKEIQFPL